MSILFEEKITTEPKLVSLAAQTRQALLDNRTMSGRDLGKYLNIPKKQAAQALNNLRARGFVEHIGYDRYGLTDKGRQAVGSELQGHNLKSLAARNRMATPLSPTVSAPMLTPSVSSIPRVTPDIDWAREYIALVNKVVESLAKRAP